MIAELNLLEVWIPEQMEPGTNISAGAGGRVGQGWRILTGAVLACPSCGSLGADYEAAVRLGWRR